ncbi:hypothetical protein [Lentilactobacillus otakiensis]|uniref:Uncharacterized protein n=1 Tax=Lentilactobacillus otakiensis DSM 19908 = JCM 15040 TaxID=1423780 RepID=S4NHS8_9LACO|nr:hypothetical protein [Lentilactobacillus otakiensis]MBZ3777780.1 hypothetical protein [Lentilactobacillus otakiensis]MDV3518345.1 hypothetical protein [Lentilactobacillus otakiensis]GAD16732.1 hypothetical protein LOT_1270 [Lentilactobacillus otakiensis DSM 19908 = JCM 15040]
MPHINRQTLRQKRQEFPKGYYTKSDGFKLLAMAVVMIAILAVIAKTLM